MFQKNVHRTLTGLGNAAGWTAILSTISNLFPDKVGRNIAFLGFATGMGVILGPMIAAGLNSIGGFSLPFFTISILQLPVAFAIVKVVPKVEPTQDDDDDSKGLLENGKRDLRLLDLFQVIRHYHKLFIDS